MSFKNILLQTKLQSAKEIKFSQKANKEIGAIFIVAGTTIGGGMLSLPIVTAQFGLFNSIGLLFLMWVVMCYSAIIMLKLSANDGYSASISALAFKHLGKFWGVVGGAAIFILFMSLLTAYTEGVSGMLSGYFHSQNSTKIVASLFALIMFILFLNKVRVVDTSNRLVFALKVISFALVLVLLAHDIDLQSVSQLHITGIGAPSHVIVTILMFFISFGFHGSIPPLLKYLDNDYKSARRSVIIGSLIPLVVFLLWIVLSLLTIYSQSQSDIAHFLSANNELSAFKELIVKSSNSKYVWLLEVFMLGAVLTSYFGVALGLIDYIKEFKLVNKVPYKHACATLVVIGLPLLMVLNSSKLFISALSVGAMQLSIIAVVLPSLIFLKSKLKGGRLKYDTPFIFIALNFILGAGIVIMELIELYNQFSF